MRILLGLLFLISGLTLSAATSNKPDPATYKLRRLEAIQLAYQNPSAGETALKSLLKEKPEDTELLFLIANAVGSRGRLLQPGKQRREVMREARDYFVRAVKAGQTDPMIATAVKEINADGSENQTSGSANLTTEKEFRAAERAFESRDFASAISHYNAALALEPKNYPITVALGDAYFAQEKFAEAIQWFEKAIALEPDRELAHRYCGDALMRLGKKDEALEHFLAAVIAEPYNGYPWRGLQTACKAMLLKVWIPAVKTPVARPTRDPKTVNVTLSKNMKSDPIDEIYLIARAAWFSKKGTAKFPPGTNYRQTLEEEVSALTFLLATYGEQKKTSALTSLESADALVTVGSSMNELAEIHSAGLLEPHILFFRANAGIAQDYADYRAKNREKLHAYLVKFYLHLP